MKKTLVILFSVILTGIGFYGCKKGANDPMISLHSRDKRVMATWTVSKADMSSVTTKKGNTINASTYQNQTTTITTSFDGSTMSSTTKNDYSGIPAPNPTSDSKKQVYSTTITLTIGKHGDAKATETDSWRSQTLSSTPSNLCGGFGTPGMTCDGTYTNTTTATTSNTYEGTWRWGSDNKKEELILELGSSVMTGTYMIDELKNKEMILKQNSTDGYTNSGASNDSQNVTKTATITLTGTGK